MIFFGTHLLINGSGLPCVKALYTNETRALSSYCGNCLHAFVIFYDIINIITVGIPIWSSHHHHHYHKNIIVTIAKILTWYNFNKVIFTLITLTHCPQKLLGATKSRAWKCTLRACEAIFPFSQLSSLPHYALQENASHGSSAFNAFPEWVANIHTLALTWNILERHANLVHTHPIQTQYVTMYNFWHWSYMYEWTSIAEEAQHAKHLSQPEQISGTSMMLHLLPMFPSPTHTSLLLSGGLSAHQRATSPHH